MFRRVAHLGILTAAWLAPVAAAPAELASDGNDAAANVDKPNIIFILSDDQDTKMNSLDYMPFLKEHMIDEGTSYPYHYCTVALCCPARAVLWTGRNAHNTNVTDLAPPWGGWPKFASQGFNDDYLPIWLSDAGYQTYYVGKIFNAFNLNNYNKPCLKGWTGSEFLIDPYTYSYINPVTSRNCGPYQIHNDTYNTDLVANASYGFLDDAMAQPDSPFFLAIAPMAPHNGIEAGVTGPPISAPKYADWFKDAKVPRTENFNPDVASGASWIKNLDKLNDSFVEESDEWYRLRLRTLQSVDEMVDNVFQKLEANGLLNNTYVFYSSDNGFHLGQHRLTRGKQLGYEEDVNVPLIVRGPGVPKGKTSNAVSAHIDMAPTFLHLAGAEQRDDLDGTPIPLFGVPDDERDLQNSLGVPKLEHANIEYWGDWAAEWEELGKVNNTYKSLRLIGEDYNLYYSVWCTNEHELYDMSTDPGQMNNLFADGFGDSPDGKTSSELGVTDHKLATRLDALMFVLKSCKGETCRQPWETLMPGSDVRTLREALSAEYDDFFDEHVPRVGYTSCEAGYLVSAEGPQLDDWSPPSDDLKRSEDGGWFARAYDPNWAEWT